MATETFRFDPAGAGNIVVGNDFTKGGYTCLVLAITSAKDGKATIQSVAVSGTKWGELQLNPSGGSVSIPKISFAPSSLRTIPLEIDPLTGIIYMAAVERSSSKPAKKGARKASTSGSRGKSSK